MKRVGQILFIYKGHHPIFSLYPPKSYKLIITLHENSEYMFLLNMTYVVIDRGIIMSIPTCVSTHYEFTSDTDVSSLYGNEMLQPNLMYKIRNYYLLTFFIHVRKSHFIQFQLLESVINKHVIYDGPGFLSPVLRNQTFQKTSSFQCIVQFLPSSNKKKCTVSFYSKLLVNDMIHELKTESVTVLQFPNKKCSRSPCVVFLSTNYGHQVNVTVDQFKTSGAVDPSCKYAGLVSEEQFSNNYRESDTICKSYGASYKPSLYSLNSSFILIFYWYKEYVTVNVSLEINSTKCKPLQIYTVDLKRICHIKLYNEPKCVSYLKNKTRYLGVQLISKYQFDLLEINITLITAKCFSDIHTLNHIGLFRTKRSLVIVISMEDTDWLMQGLLQVVLFLG